MTKKAAAAADDVQPQILEKRKKRTAMTKKRMNEK
jgi:hypothetical protein